MMTALPTLPDLLNGAAEEILSRTDAPRGVAIGVANAGGTVVVACGDRDVHGTQMDVDDVFDVASVTKVAATTALVMRLVVLGKLAVDDCASDFLPWLTGEKKEITVRDLLAHRSGLWEWQPLYTRAASADEVKEEIARLPLRYPVREGWHYSDLGFMVLGFIIEQITGHPLDAAYAELVADPLGLTSGYRTMVGERTFVTSALDNAAEQRMIATGDPYPIVLGTEFDEWRSGPILGEVNDGNSYHAFGGVSGHAGLFATVNDLLTFGSALADPGRHGDFFDESVVKEFLAESRTPEQALGFRRQQWQIKEEPVTVYWHPGFTGCALGIVPENGTVIAMGTNRLLSETSPAPVPEMWATVLGALGFEQQGRS